MLKDPQRELLIDDIVLGQEDPQRMARRHPRIESRGNRRGGRDPRNCFLREQSDQGVEKLRLTKRLGEICREQRVGIAGFASSERTEQHQRQRGVALTDFARQRHAVHLGHVHVDDGQIERLTLFEPTQRFLRRFSRPRSHAPFGRLQFEDAPIGGVVVDDQHPFALQRALHADEVALTREGKIADRRNDAERERRSFAGTLTLGPHASAHQLA